MNHSAFDAFIGPLAGVTTSVLWTATSLFFTAASKRLGPTVVNATRIGFAILLLGLTHRLLNGIWVPHLHTRQLLCLGFSGFIGLAIGDQALLTAFMLIGPRLAMLIMTTSPLMAAMFGWAALGETLHPMAWLGIAMTLSGVAWVVLERPSASVADSHRPLGRGVLLALVGALCQAGGLLLSKQGMGHGWLPDDQRLAPQTATLTRMVFAGLGMIPIVIINYRWERRARVNGIVPRRDGNHARDPSNGNDSSRLALTDAPADVQCPNGASSSDLQCPNGASSCSPGLPATAGYPGSKVGMHQQPHRGCDPTFRSNEGPPIWSRNPRGNRSTGLALACCGAVTGPFLGVWCSLVATDRAPLGVAQTLCSLAPVFLLPVVMVFHKERVSLRAAAGAVIAVSGSALLVVRG